MYFKVHIYVWLIIQVFSTYNNRSPGSYVQGYNTASAYYALYDDCVVGSTNYLSYVKSV